MTILTLYILLGYLRMHGSVQDEAEFVIQRDTSQKGHDTLTERDGYSYVVSRQRQATTYWRCSVRNRQRTCLATVTQYENGEFRHGRHPHNHPAAIGVGVAKALLHNAKVLASHDVFQPAAEVVDKVLREAHLERPCPALPAVGNIVRIANRYRSAMRPKDPQDLSFTIDDSYIPPDFLQSDIAKHGQRHLIFYSADCLRLLSIAKSWYIDGTFAVVSKPFQQLLSIHCFVEADSCVKQVPLVYILMSRNKTKDYTAVLKSIRSRMPFVAVRRITSDFERALWRAIANVFPQTKHRGCTFHWTQAVYRKIQGLGLAVQYRDDRHVHKLCRRVMALPLLPAAQIPEQFDRLRQQAVSRPMHALFEYVANTWLSDALWPPSSWSAFRRPIRTNNDVEGWHYRLNRRARSHHLPFYVLVRLLWEESQTSKLSIQLVSDQKLKRNQKKKYRSLHCRLDTLWTEYESGEKSAKKLLNACAFMYGPKE